MVRRRRYWGWGYEDEGLDLQERKSLHALVAARFGLSDLSTREPPAVADLDLRPPRLAAPRSLEPLCTAGPYERAAHAYGKSFRDVVRALRGEFPHPPDLVAFPRDEGDVAALLDWCAEAGAAAIPYGGGSSVVGGVEADVGEGYRGAVSIDLRRLDRVLEVDTVSRAARIQAGVLGPALEDQLEPYGLTLRHFPQSFEQSSLGGWIATRSAGHFATGPTRIDELVEALRAVTPRGVLETRRLPGSGAGPSPDRLLCGSEGTLGVITEAWVRLHARPAFRASASASFPGFEHGVEAVRALAQSGLQPSNCRLLDPVEALVSGSGDGSRALLLVGFESGDHPLDAWLARAAEICREQGGDVEVRLPREGAAGAWRTAFFRGPFVRDALAQLGMIAETFETAVTWDRFQRFHAAVTAAAQEAAAAACGAALVSCRLTHAYPDGAAPYYTVIAPGRPGAELEQWGAVKQAASEAILAHGGTITHHHAVGRDHRPWYDRESPPLFAEALRAAKAVLDPAGILNPGVLLDPPR